jgi:tetratricopeptide (TPR) repeat protein
VGEAKDRLKNGKAKDARKVLQNALALDPENADAARLLDAVVKEITAAERVEKLLLDAAFAQKHDRGDEAAALLREILGIDPSHKEALRGLQKVGKSGPPASAALPVPTRPRRISRSFVFAGAGILVVLVGILWFMMRPSQTVVPVSSSPPAVDSSAFVASARRETVDAKAIADDASASTWAATTYASGREIEQRADRAAAAKNHIIARQLFEEAGRTYRASAEESRRTQTGATVGLGELKRMVSGARAEMRSAKGNAQTAGGKGISAFQSFRDALAMEQEGDRTAASGEQKGLLAARGAYTTAREGYTRAASEATFRAEGKKQMQAASAETRTARQRVPGSESEKQGSASYRAATDKEASAARYVLGEDLQKAREEYEKATRLFTTAGNEILAARSAPKISSEPPRETPAEGMKKESEKKDPAVREKEERETAQREIRRLLEDFRVSMEQGNLKNLTTLLNLAPEKQKEWSLFFGASEDRKVTMEIVELDVTQDNARVNFRVKMSFFNQAANTTQSTENMRQWSLQGDHGVWKIVTQK